MTKEEVIRNKEAIRSIEWLKCITNREDDLEALDMAIEVLRKELNRFEMIISASERYLGVVRCKDCKYADFESPYPVCNLIEMNITDDDFCSWGEREEE